MTLADSTILVVDDEPVLRLTFSIVLKQAGATVMTAEDGVDALRVLDHHHIDVVLSDKQMPNMDGLTLLENLRERGVTAPAIFFVNGVVPDDAALLARLGVVRTVTKPLHPVELTRILERVLEPMPAHEKQ